jgi:hypothetical protein
MASCKSLSGMCLEVLKQTKFSVWGIQCRVSNRTFVECKPETVPPFSICSFRVCGAEMAGKDRSPSFE